MLWYYHYCLFFIACGDDNTDIPGHISGRPTEPAEANPDIVNLGLTQCKQL